jgi:peroxiredoxin
MKKIIALATSFIIASVLFAQQNPEGLFPGGKAPDFTGFDQNGNEINLKELTKKGPVVLVFYRGYWCPFCSKALKRLEDSLQLITAKGATVIAVSPEINENIDSTVKKTGAEFSILHDKDMKIMKAYNVAFQVPENTVTRYRNSGIDFTKLNGENGNNLPVPAVYVIDKQREIRWRFFEADYKKRPSIQSILDNLDKIILQ